MSTGRPITSAPDWLRGQERRMRAQERRPAPRSAQELLGPGIGPSAVLVSDWNDDLTAFNGMFYSPVGALHSPDPTHGWIGWSLIDADGSGLQRVQRYGSDVGGTAQIRGFTSPAGSTRVYTAWAAE